MLGGLVLANNTLRDLEQRSYRSDVAQASIVVGSVLRSRVDELGVLEALYLDGAPPTEGEFDALFRALPHQLRHFRRVWVTDSAGVLIAQRVNGPEAPSLPAGWDVDEEPGLGLAELVARARETELPVVTPLGRLHTGDSGFVSVRPVVVHGRLHGFVGGSTPLAALTSALGPLRLSGARAVAVTSDPAGRDTMYHDTAGALGGTQPVEHTVALPDGRTWMLRAHFPVRSILQLQLLLVGIAAASAMVVGVLHERRQMQRIAERSRELEHLSHELLRVNKAKSEFLANVSHELRTPLTAIVGFAELLKDGVYGVLSPRQTGPVERIEASAAHLRTLVDQVLDLAKMAAGRLELHPERVDLRQFVLDVATELEPLVSERGLALTLAVGSVPRLRTDPTHLRQILVNLVGNAAKFTSEGSVTVRARLVTPAGGGREGAGLRARAPNADATWIALQVVDTGIGIAPRDQERVFDEFEQVNAGARSDSDRRGTGLGLPISRRLARLLGGELTLESAVGKGSTFTLWLPVEGEAGARVEG